MNSKDTMNVLRGRFHSLRWLGVAVILFSVLPGFCCELFALENSGPCINSTRQSARQAPEPATLGRAKVAEGEYKVLAASGVGSFDFAVYDFTESWTLWRLEDGRFEVDGTRDYRSPADEPHRDNFEACLSDSFRVLKLREFRTLRWRQNTGPLDCDFLSSKIACTANAKDKSQDLSLEMPVQASAGLMWPISAFSLSSIARSASRDSKKLTPVELLTIEEPSDVDPVFITTLGGYLKYLGQEKLILAGREWLADKFELKVAMHAPFLLWTSSQGLLLAFAHEKNGNRLPDNEGMVLVSFHKWQEF